MTDQPVPASSRAEQALDVLCQLMYDPEASSARVAAAKAVLGRPEPKNDEEHKREAEEREMSLAAARGILADLAADKLAGLHEPGAVDPASTPEPADAAAAQTR